MTRTVGIAYVAHVVEQCVRARKIVRPHHLRTHTRAVASWLLTAGGVMPSRVAEVLGITHAAAYFSRKSVDRELVAGGGPRVDALIDAIGRLATHDDLDLEVPGRGERCNRAVTVHADSGLVAVDRSQCPPQRPCHRSECRYHLGTLPGSASNCTLERSHDAPHTLAEVAQVLGLTPERVRQIETIALRKLRTHTMEHHR